ncbi:DUF2142 domain-containing protein [Bifidobacterium aquikefiri]|uniref:DUF2142 domain-containing protein n=1 Tax=Bifidobacterium aquikefiri TaxID=1653207 RepID=UPI0039E91038
MFEEQTGSDQEAESVGSTGRSCSLSDKFRSTVRILPVIVFLILCLCETSWFLVRLGPLTSPDPDMHGPTIYALATGKVFSPVQQESDSAGNRVKRQQLSGDSRFLFLEGRHNLLDIDAIELSIKGDPGTWQQRLSNSQPMQLVHIPDSRHSNRSNQYFPLLYLPQAVGLRVAIWSGMTPYSSWQLARISNAIGFMLVWGAAIFMIPRGKWVLTVIGIMPSIVYLASSLMSDGNIIAVCGLFVALLLHCLVADTKIPHTIQLLLGFLFLILLYSKILYAIPILILLVLPQRLMTAKAKMLSISAPIVVFIVTYVPWSVSFGGMLAIGNVNQNLHKMLSHPLWTTRLIVHSMTKMTRLFMHQPHWFLPQFVLLLAAWLCALAAVLAKNQVDTVKPRSAALWISQNRYWVTTLVLCIVSIFMMYVALAVTWNNLQAPDVTELGGFQIRYVYPLLPFSAFAFVPHSHEVQNDETFTSIATNA